MFRDAHGTVPLTGARRFMANWSVHITEAAAAMFAIELAQRLGYGDIYLEGDSLTVLNAISKKEAGSTYFHTLLDHTLALISCFPSFKCSFVRRHGNTVAHMIARQDTGNAMEKICMAPFPLTLQTLVDLDLS